MKNRKTYARDIMSSNLVTIRSDQTYRHAIELLTTHRLTGLPVVDREGILLGMLSEKEILKECGSIAGTNAEFLESRIKFRKKVKTAKLKTPIDRVARTLSGKSYRHIPIVDDAGVLRGIITRRDLIRILYLRIELHERGMLA